ncbi:hypothetical protein DNU06_04330 [Putridiphycobacter roseus]|uniref:Uncharacterized protein n=1 Tax=Putridiphycobacter roseus TaxID=2219161 RepID=A0A2W1NQE0_9FLAO|nr:DUF4153 domain-containing protein [Putridiphycobacter roseus]PZE17852.1 hypothetical protein DNU06_04330 [Putridiphycobacter roseus]
MKKKQYLLLVLLLNCLLYDQLLGLNLLLIAIFWVGLNYYNSPTRHDKSWYTAAILWIMAGLGQSLWYLDVGLPIYIIAALHYFAVYYQPKTSFPISILQSFISWAKGLVNFFQFKVGYFNKSTDQTKKIIQKLLLIILPIFISLLFLKIYQSASPKFAELTSFIHLDFIQWPFFISYFLLTICFYGFYYFRPSKKIESIDINTAYQVPYKESYLSEEDKKPFEWQLGILLVSMLSLLLLGFIVVDIQTILTPTASELSHSQVVHQGINILIISIILVMLIVVGLYRGSNNFQKSKTLHYLSYAWLFLNAILIVLIAIKNYNYIADWGLTHKRIGVFIYLIMCLIGLAFTGRKIAKQTSFSHLLSKTAYTFLGLLTFYGLFNWNGIIAKYNLNPLHLDAAQVDFPYLASLGPETLPYIKAYIGENNSTQLRDENTIHQSVFSLYQIYSQGWKSIPSYRLGGYLAYKKLNFDRLPSKNDK